MLVQMLCGEKLDFYPETFSIDNEERIKPMNIVQNLQLPNHTSDEARSCVRALLENDPEKRLGSSNSPYGLIRDHPFFKVGHSINWQEIDDGIFKPSHKNLPVTKRKIKHLLQFNIFSLI